MARFMKAAGRRVSGHTLEGREDRLVSDPATKTDVYYCFRLLLNREPGPEGWKIFMGLARGGVRRDDLVSFFLDSTEFRNRQAQRERAHRRTTLVQLEHLKIYVSPEDALIGRAIIETRQYEPHVTAALQRSLRPGMVFVDVGANIGYLSLVAAHRVGSDGRVIAFEPSQRNCSLLSMSAAANRFENIEIHPFAVADTERNVFYDDMHGTGTISEFDPDVADTPSRMVLRTVTLDRALRDEPRVDVIKIDVDGAEPLVVQGALNILRSRRPVLFVEFAPTAIEGVSKATGAHLLELLFQQGYEVSAIEGARQVLGLGTSVASVLEYFARRGRSHIDLVATHTDHAGGAR